MSRPARRIIQDIWNSEPVSVEVLVAAPAPTSPERLRDSFFEAIGGLTLGLVQARHWSLGCGPLRLLRFGEPEFSEGAWTWPIRGGLLAGRAGGSFGFGWRHGRLVGFVRDYLPRLPVPLYRRTQLPLHRLLTRLFLLGLRGRVPAPGVPVEPLRRMTATALDLAICGTVAACLPRRRAAGWLLLAAAYHAGFWSATGRTPGALVARQRLVSVDGGPVSLGQAAVRLGALPLALARMRTAHDDAAQTAVVDAS